MPLRQRHAGDDGYDDYVYDEERLFYAEMFIMMQMPVQRTAPLR